MHGSFLCSSDSPKIEAISETEHGSWWVIRPTRRSINIMSQLLRAWGTHKSARVFEYTTGMQNLHSLRAHSSKTMAEKDIIL